MFLVIRTPTCVSRTLVLQQGANTLERNLTDAPNFGGGCDAAAATAAAAAAAAAVLLAFIHLH